MYMGCLRATAWSMSGTMLFMYGQFPVPGMTDIVCTALAILAAYVYSKMRMHALQAEGSHLRLSKQLLGVNC